MSELIWVAVPGGLHQVNGAKAAKLSVVIVPTLTGTSLAGTGMEHWPPPGLAGSTLSVELRSEPDTAAVPVLVPLSGAGQPGLWESFFKPDTPIDADDAGGATPPQVQVEPTSQTAAAVQQTYEACAQASITADSHATLEAVMRTQLKANWLQDGTAPPTPQPAPAAPPPLDFGKIYNLLREHPAVLRALGLILDLEIPASVAIPAAGGVVCVSWPGAPQPPLLPAIQSPWSQFGPEFFPGSTTNVSSGMVTLTDDRPLAPLGAARWQTATVDVQGAAERFRSTARALNSTAGTDASMVASEALPPALRSGGIQLLRPNRSEGYSERSRASAAFEERKSLTADDLTLGYRVDVKLFGQGTWFSLQQRKATYSLGTEPIGPAASDEEGQLKPYAALDHGGGQVRADEIVARWTGWSLGVPFPSFVPAGDPPAGGGGSTLPFDFSSTFSVTPGSLPPLRFGQQYVLRARVADLAGGGLGPADPAADCFATDPVSYRRHEPVLSPIVGLADSEAPGTLGPGESEVVVLMRSEGGPDGGTTADFAQQNPRYPMHVRRKLGAPEASIEMAEQHGKLDQKPPETTFAWLQRALGGSAGTGARLPDPAAGDVCAFPVVEAGAVAAERADCVWSEVCEETGGAEARMAWVQKPGTGDVLEVNLGKGEQVSVEFSTFLAPHLLDRFALAGVPGLPAASSDLAEQGRHPMVTPARAVRFVPAIRRPLLPPQGALTAGRTKGQTFADLTQQPPTLGVDVNSTAKIQLFATWQERDDEQPPRAVSAAVQTVELDPGASALKENLRHEFGDTRYRSVNYTATAVSRFRHFFAEAEAPEAFLLQGLLTSPVDILSSARPAPPVVLSIRPAYYWEEQQDHDAGSATIRRTRRASYLRVELARPWYETGDGELAAIVTSTDGRPPADASAFLTQVGSDPIWNSTTPPRWPTPATCTETAGPGGGSALLPELGQSVNIAVYQPWFGGQSWFVDVAMPSVAEASYCPLVQLAVCRYQPNSLFSEEPGAEIDLRLSSAVKAEFTPLFPERRLTVTRTESEVRVLLEGLGPTGPHTNEVDAVLEHLALPAGVPASAVEFTALTLDPSGPVAWTAVAEQIQSDGALGTPIRLTMPADPGSYRVRVREVERVGKADDAAGSQLGTAGELSERVVFADVVAVPET